MKLPRIPGGGLMLIPGRSAQYLISTRNNVSTCSSELEEQNEVSQCRLPSLGVVISLKRQGNRDRRDFQIAHAGFIDLTHSIWLSSNRTGEVILKHGPSFLLRWDEL
jgi:hypothetical protein